MKRLREQASPPVATHEGMVDRKLSHANHCLGMLFYSIPLGGNRVLSSPLSHCYPDKAFIDHQVHAQTKVIDVSKVIAPVGTGVGYSKGALGARQRKSSCPVRSL